MSGVCSPMKAETQGGKTNFLELIKFNHCTEGWVKNEKIWNDNACPHLRNLNKDLPSCKSACLSTNRCTAFNWNRYSNDCVLRACQIVEPNWNYNHYTGHKIVVGTSPLRWKTTAKIYNDDICPHLKNIKNRHMRLESCKSACLADKRCTALNWSGKAKNCVLRACPMVAPNWDHNSYEGYNMVPR